MIAGGVTTYSMGALTFSRLRVSRRFPTERTLAQSSSPQDACINSTAIPHSHPSAAMPYHASLNYGTYQCHDWLFEAKHHHSWANRTLGLARSGTHTMLHYTPLSPLHKKGAGSYDVQP